MDQISLSALDFINMSPAGYRKNIQSVLRCAQIAEDAGFSRYWLTEHHGWCASSSPEMLLGLIAGATRTINVGVAGILLSLYHPYKVASSFQVLAELFPGRIDLGVCNGRPSADVMRYMQGGSSASFEEKVAELQQHLRVDVPAQWGLPKPCSPHLWLLGTGVKSSQLSQALGIPYCHSIFHAGASQGWSAPDVAASPRVQAPGLAIAGTCGGDVADCAPNPFVVPIVVGAPEACGEKIMRLAEFYNVTHIVWHDIARTRKAQFASMQNLSQALASIGMLKAA
ncbi:LLM class flavin-dependent oxidoreductase [Undibacterium sp.]|jgi:hypothetical protein|uniref:LLM class flavin-dependent oxidoreductase n=1 Tax=Undibacterium sp. TaxID=1914977 RepID=UPI002B7C48C4|nr:LLM class flavin-dependent oxidoreductase [Undibacterium sp.]HTD05217.1 LLM class flavin-dependent oxidoreductase [Undibacterium sp.]